MAAPGVFRSASIVRCAKVFEVVAMAPVFFEPHHIPCAQLWKILLWESTSKQPCETPDDASHLTALSDDLASFAWPIIGYQTQIILYFLWMQRVKVDAASIDFRLKHFGD